MRSRAGRDEGEIGEQAAQPNGVTNDPCRSGGPEAPMTRVEHAWESG